MNIVRFFPKIALAASVSLALAFTLSCSSDSDDSSGGNGGSSGPTVKTFDVEYGEGSFTYEEANEWYGCQENGELKKNSYPKTVKIDYSIKDNVLSWDSYWEGEDDVTIDFNGNSNIIIGTWTRTKNKEADCKQVPYREGEYRCKDDFDVTKAVFGETTVEITRDYCPTYWRVENTPYGNYTQKNITCDTYEFHDENSNVITVKETGTSRTVTYKGSKACTVNYEVLENQQKACREASAKYATDGGSLENLYEDFLWADYVNCLEDINFPIDIEF